LPRSRVQIFALREEITQNRIFASCAANWLRLVSRHARGCVSGKECCGCGNKICCGSSVAEHPLGKGEVESSILSHSTITLKPLDFFLKVISAAVRRILPSSEILKRIPLAEWTRFRECLTVQMDAEVEFNIAPSIASRTISSDTRRRTTSDSRRSSQVKATSSRRTMIS
jgi:hypothetical protein